MNIAGMGVVGARGRGMAALERALEEGWRAPVEVEARGVPSGRLPVYAVAPEALNDKTVLAKARRADRFTRMAVLAAVDALADSGLDTSVDKARLGVIVATALGPHVTTFGFLDGILDFGDAAVSPTAFSHSVHNAAASYIAMTLDARGPTLTVTHFDFAFQQAVVLAGTWLADNRCDAVLVGGVDELGAVMQHVCGRMLRPAADGRIKPFSFSANPEVVPGEGSAFFVLTRETDISGYGRIRVAEPGAEDVPGAGLSDGLVIPETGGLSRDETAYRRRAMAGVPTANFAPLFGSVMTGSAFHTAVGALTLRRQKRYACPVTDNPHGLTLCRETMPAPVTEVRLVKIDCSGRRLSTVLWRP